MRIEQNLIGRIAEPMNFRFILQAIRTVRTQGGF